MPPIATQLWTFRHEYAEDPLGVLDRIAEIGYPAVEAVYALTGDLSFAATRAALEERGLDVCSLHAFFDELEAELDAVLDAAETLGTDRIVCAWVDEHQRRSAADYEAIATSLGSMGARCAQRGMRLAYHHHDFELAEFDGRRGIDIILDGVSADLLAVEPDVYWVHTAGFDPAEYLTALGERCILLHCKDHLAPGAAPLAQWSEGVAIHNAEVGSGVLDWPAILRAAPTAEWLIVEQDLSAGDPFASAALSLRNLRDLATAETPA